MKNIVITGSTRGIGLEMAKVFLSCGCNVTLSGRGESLFHQAEDDLNVYKNKYIYVPCNVREVSHLQKLWDVSCNKWGSIDIWINNAGQNAPFKFLYNTETRYVEDIISTNINGMIYGSQIAATGMLKQKYGAIYSMEGLGSNNMIQKKTVLYGTTKHALTYFMKGLAKELDGTGVIAGRLSPGMMLTDFITKSPDGDVAAIQTKQDFKKIFNILADKPETVAEYLVPRILKNNKNNVQIEWLSNAKAMGRFLKSPFIKRKLI
ncbi:MAG: SDR family NAD(P)-dependent oxidoreductase [Eubacteriales bacterium]